MTLAEKLELESYRFDKDKELQAEFGGDKAAYIAFVRADFLNLVKIHGKARNDR